RQAVADLEAKIARGNERLFILPPDRLPGAIDLMRTWERERDEAKRRLHRAETQSPCRDLEQRIAAAEEMLWRLEELPKAEDAPLLRELLREAITKVELHWTHEKAGTITRAHFAGAEVYLQSTEEPYLLSPAAARSRYWCCRALPGRMGRRAPGWRTPRS